jgi:prepilin-type N-terminal cleavage/methylation domain-containing protein
MIASTKFFKNNAAFSLVELSIVLVILGLLTGGILTGQSLIKAAELRAVPTEAEQFAAAVNTFKGKYFGLPGDITNATSFWGDNNTHCADGAITNGTPGTCNGDGDGAIEVAGANAEGEIFMFWNQLALAGLINGQFSGIAGTGSGFDSDAGVNAPASKLSSGIWAVFYHSGDHGIFFRDVSGLSSNDLMVGADTGTVYPENPLLRPEDAWNIDKKMDDGQPGRGKVQGGHWSDDCSSANDGSSATNDYDASYRLTDSSVQCALLFKDAF